MTTSIVCGSIFWRAGAAAHREGIQLESNPHFEIDTWAYHAWEQGWLYWQAIEELEHEREQELGSVLP